MIRARLSAPPRTRALSYPWKKRAKILKKLNFPLIFKSDCVIISNWHILALHISMQSQSPKGGERIMNKYELIYIIDTALE